MQKFASDEVAAAAENSIVAEVLAAREELEESFLARDVEAVAELFALSSIARGTA